MIDPSTLDFDKAGGLIPVVVQDAATLQVLTLAYMDRAALDETLDSGEATFFSRSRGGRWRRARPRATACMSSPSPLTATATRWSSRSGPSAMPAT